MLQAELEKNGLGSIEDCKDDIPIIIQSFDIEAILYYEAISDLPLAFALGVKSWPFKKKLKLWLNYCFISGPYTFKTAVPDSWEEFSQHIYAVAPSH